MANWFERFLDGVGTPKPATVSVPAEPVKPPFQMKWLDGLGHNIGLDEHSFYHNTKNERYEMDMAFGWASSYDEFVIRLLEHYTIPMEMDIDGPKMFQRAYDRKIQKERDTFDRESTKGLCIKHSKKLYELPDVRDLIRGGQPLRINTGFGVNRFDIAIRECMRRHIMSIKGHGDVKWLSEGDIIHVVEKEKIVERTRIEYRRR